jgi:hypothetical protein
MINKNVTIFPSLFYHTFMTKNNNKTDCAAFSTSGDILIFHLMKEILSCYLIVAHQLKVTLGIAMMTLAN